MALLMAAGCVTYPHDDHGFPLTTRSEVKLAARKEAEAKAHRQLLSPKIPMPPEVAYRQSLELAESNNRDLARARRQFKRALLERKIAEANILTPTLTGNYSSFEDSISSRLGVAYASSLGLEFEPFLQTEYDNSRSPENTTELGITVSRRLFNLAESVRLRLPISRANRDLLVAANDLRLEKRRLSFRVTQAFYAIQRARARIVVRENRVRDAREFMDIIRNRVLNGFAAPVEEANALINLNQAEADLIVEQTNFKNARDNLLGLLGVELDTRFGIQPEDVSQIPDFQYDVEADTEIVNAYHESLVNQRLNIDFARKEILVQKDLLMPQVTLGLTAQRRTRDNHFFGRKDPNTDDVGVVISYTTFLDGKKRDKSRLKQLSIEQEERQLSMKDTSIDLERRLRSIARRIEQLKVQIQLAEDRVDAQRRRLNATMKSYESGEVDNLEVTRAKQDMDDAEIRLLDARIDLRIAVSEYKSILPPRPRMVRKAGTKASGRTPGKGTKGGP